MKNGFTLAEVLITLGIIGVVAALTLPSLIENEKRKQKAVALSKFYSTMTQAVTLWKAKNEVTDIENYFTPQDLDNADSIEQWYNEIIKPNVKTIHSEIKLPYHISVAFNDGSGFVAYVGGPSSSPVAYLFYCTKYKYCRPESYDGNNTFLFTFTNNGKFITSMNGAEKFTRDELIKLCKKGAVKGARHYCTRLIEVDGWEFKKDYPWKQVLE